MAITVRKPYLVVRIDGTRLPRVLEAIVVRGMDQELATAQVMLAGPLPSQVKLWGRITITMGDLVESPHGLSKPRFTGYVVSLEAGLWPGSFMLNCEDILAIAKRTYTRVQISLFDMTDQEAVELILEECGYPAALYSDLDGTGKIISDFDIDANVVWAEGQTALDKIAEIDMVSLGHRTCATTGGKIIRRFVDPTPTEGFVHEFVEGVDLLEGSLLTEQEDAKNEVTIVGALDTSSNTNDGGVNTYQFKLNPYWKEHKMLTRQAASETHLSTEEQAAWVLSQLNRNIVKATFSTHLDIMFQSIESIKLTSPHLISDTPYWVQSIQTALDDAGTFTQTITGVSELERLRDPATELPPPMVDPTTGSPLDPPNTPPGGGPPVDPPPEPPSDDDILVDFSLTGVQCAPGVGAEQHTVSAADLSTSTQGTIVSQAWTASAGGLPATGTGPAFNTAFAVLTGATITLVVVDSNGSTGTLTKPVEGSGVGAQSRTLYVAAEDWIEAYSGTVWVTYALPVPSTPSRAAANGPHWSAGAEVASSADNLATAPSLTVPFTSVAATTLWKEPDVAPNRVGAGSAVGSFSVSEDGGATWSAPIGGPFATSVLRFVISRESASQWWALYQGGVHVSDNAGAGWRELRAPAPGQLFRDMVLSHTRNVVASSIVGGGVSPLETIEAGTPFTFPVLVPPVTDILSVFPGIGADVFYCIDAAERTFRSDAPGSFAMVQGVNIPAGEAVVRSGVADGTIPDLLYFAAGTGGVWKSADAFASADGYAQLRAPGTDGAPAGPYLMVGAGALGTCGAAGTSRVYLLGVDTALLYKSTDGGVTFTALTLPTAWAGIDGFDALSGAFGNDVLYVVDGFGATAKSVDGGATWAVLTDTAGIALGPYVSIVDPLTVIVSDQIDAVKTVDGGTVWTPLALAGDLGAPVLAAEGGAKIWGVRNATQFDKARANLDESGEETFTVAPDELYGHTPISDTLAFAHADFRSISEQGLLYKIDGTTVTAIPTGSAMDVIPDGGYYAAAYAPPDASYYLALIVDRDNQGFAVGEIWRSVDAGATWAVAASDAGLDPHYGVPSQGFLRPDPNDPTHWFCIGGDAFAASDAQLWRSSDSGVTWTGAVAAAGEARLAAVRACSG